MIIDAISIGFILAVFILSPICAWTTILAGAFAMRGGRRLTPFENSLLTKSLWLSCGGFFLGVIGLIVLCLHIP